MLSQQFAVVTPESHPGHHTVGRRFRGWDGHIYCCDSYDSRIGYWMTREDAPEANHQDQSGPWRRNVSERAIGRTYHEVQCRIPFRPGERYP